MYETFWDMGVMVAVKVRLEGVCVCLSLSLNKHINR